MSLQGASQVWLAGCLPYIHVSAKNVLYQNIRLHQVAVTAQAIRLHWPFLQQKGEPFLEPITVEIQAVITEENLNDSLPYLQEILCPYGQQFDPEMTVIQGLTIQPQGITWFSKDRPQYLTQVQLVSPHQLILTPAVAPSAQQVLIDLGTDVLLQECQLHPGALHLAGSLIIRPAAPTASQSNRPGVP